MMEEKLKFLEAALHGSRVENVRLIEDNVRLRNKIGEVIQHQVDAWRPAPDSLSADSILRFIEEFDATFDGHLSGVLNYARVVSLAHFARIVKVKDIADQPSVGVISGYLREWELTFLKPGKVTTVNFEHDPINNLDASWLDRPSLGFSMTICNQVLEHVFNPHVAFKNLVHHTAPGGYLYVSIPAANCIHGEPNFFSSGFHPRFLERLAHDNQLEILEIDHWGSYKYMVNAVSGYWLSESQLRPNSTQGVQFAELLKMDGRTNEDRYMTDCWGLFRKH